MHVHTINLLKQLIQAPGVVTAISTLDSVLTEVICLISEGLLKSMSHLRIMVWKRIPTLRMFQHKEFSCSDPECCRLRSLRFLILRLFSFACLNKASTELLQGFYVAVGYGNFNFFPQVLFLRDYSSVQLPNPFVLPSREW